MVLSGSETVSTPLGKSERIEITETLDNKQKLKYALTKKQNEIIKV